MEDLLHAGAIDDDTVRVELDGETHDLSVTVAKQLSRELYAAIEMLQGARNEDSYVINEDDDPDRKFVDVLTTAEDIGPIVAERLEERFDSLEDVADASDEELERVEIGSEGVDGDTRALFTKSVV